ncbi:MAG: urease accessory protein UreD [Geminicoccaceae bacterium]
MIINLGGGMTDGDRFTVELDLEPAAELVATTQAAEKAYRSRGGLATVVASARLGPASSLHWLPQETIVYDGSRLRRELSVDLSADACFLGTEAIILGRKASGETLHDAVVLDRCSIRRNGLLVWHDSLRLAGDLSNLADGAALLGGAGALATVLVAVPGAESMVETMRELSPAGVRTGVSSRSGVVAARFLAPDGAALRTALAAFLLALRSTLKGREVALPRVWAT